MYNFNRCEVYKKVCVGFFRKTSISPERRFLCKHCHTPYVVSWVGWIIIGLSFFLVMSPIIVLLRVIYHFHSVVAFFLTGVLGLILDIGLTMILYYYVPIKGCRT